TIPCWGEKEFELSFDNKRFKWPLLLAAVKFPILGVDFLRHHRLLVDPAANCLVSAANAAVAAVVSTMLPPQQPSSCAASAGAASAGPASAGAASAGAASAGPASAGPASAGPASAGAASAGPDSCPLQPPERPVAVDMSQPFEVWLAELLREFD
ncbi:MAG: hypothetical protein ACK53Y_02820, partial [bacterium]